MKFIHLADCHLDGYREEKLNKLSLDSFEYVMNLGIEKKVDFILLAGDLFNTALPKLDILKECTSILKKIKDVQIPIYFIPGSHDFSPNGKTMLDVLENAGLMTNVFQGDVTPDGSLMLKWTVDPKTNTHITGILGKKGMLDKNYYEKLDYSNLVSDEFKIFMFHTAITEMKPKELEMMESFDVKTLPPGFDYYAGGHVHICDKYNDEKHSNVVYPGPTFPNSFSELAKLVSGSYVYFEDGNYSIEKIPAKALEMMNVDCEDKNPEEVMEKVSDRIEKLELKDKIVLMRFSGILKSGKVSDIDFKLLNKLCLDKGAFIVLKNTSKLKSKEFIEMEISEESSEDIEENTIKEHLSQIDLPEGFNEKKLIEELMKVLDTEQQDGEKKSSFNERLIEETKKTLI